MKFLTLLALFFSFNASAAWYSNCYVTAAKSHGIPRVISTQLNLFVVISNAEVVIFGTSAFLPGKTELEFDEIVKGFNAKKIGSYFGNYSGQSPSIPQNAEIIFQVPKVNFNSAMFTMYERFSPVMKVDTVIYSLACQIVPSNAAPASTGSNQEPAVPAHAKPASSN